MSRARRFAVCAVLAGLLIAGLPATPARSEPSSAAGWVNGIGGTDIMDVIEGIAVDATGNTYVAGAVGGSVDFDPGPGVVTPPEFGYQDVVVAKYDPLGNLLWVNRVGGGSGDLAWDIALDFEGNVLVTGAFGDEVDFDPGAGTDVLVAFVNPEIMLASDVFIWKLDSEGNHLWVRRLGSVEFDAGFGVATGGAGMVYVTGYIRNVVDLNTDDDATLYVDAVGTDMFVVALDGDGDFAWGKAIHGPSSEEGNDIAVDSEERVVVVGEFHDTIDFDPGPGTSELVGDGETPFVLRLNADGTFDLAVAPGDGSGRGVALTADDAIAIAGEVNVQVSPTSVYTNVFVTLLGSDGQLEWTESWQGTYGSYALALNGGPDDTFYLAAQGAFYLDPVDPAPTLGGAIMARIDRNGLLLWIDNPISQGVIQDLAAGLDQSVHAAGEYTDTAWFYLPERAIQHTSNGGPDGFALRMTEPTAAVIRYSGLNRYGTAAAIAAGDYPVPDAVDTVFVAAGSDFPDAVAGATIAARIGAPLLLVSRDEVPAETAIELTRLHPATIVILGGTTVIPDAIAEDLGAYAQTVLRLAGADRYGTAVEISEFGFPSPGSADVVIVATGLGFADALAGGPAGAALNGPVLLTRPDHLPAAVAAEIDRLDPSRILVIGGPAAISDNVVFELEELAPEVDRIFGADRYATAVAISTEAFPRSARAYVATGLNFPDALAGGAAAGSRLAPILLVPGTTVPAGVADEIDRLGAYVVIILGGTAAVSSGVETNLGALLGT